MKLETAIIGHAKALSSRQSKHEVTDHNSDDESSIMMENGNNSIMQEQSTSVCSLVLKKGPKHRNKFLPTLQHVCLRRMPAASVLVLVPVCRRYIHLHRWLRPQAISFTAYSAITRLERFLLRVSTRRIDLHRRRALNKDAWNRTA